MPVRMDVNEEKEEVGQEMGARTIDKRRSGAVFQPDVRGKRVQG